MPSTQTEGVELTEILEPVQKAGKRLFNAQRDFIKAVAQARDKAAELGIKLQIDETPTQPEEAQ